MKAMREGGLTLAQIGERYGVTKERVRQLLTYELGPQQSRQLVDALVEKRKTETRERKAAERLAELLRRCETSTPCAACGAWVLRGSSYTCCSSECTESWRRDRYTLSEEARAKHRLSQARAILKRPHVYRPACQQWAKRVLAGTDSS